MNDNCENKTDQEFLDGMRNRDSEAFKCLYERFFNLTNFVNENSGNLEDTKDVFQDNIIIAIKCISKPDFKLSSKLSTFLRGIIQRVWWAKLRKNKDLLSNDMEKIVNQVIVDNSDIEEKRNREKKHLLIEKLFKSLGEDCQKLLHMSFFERLKGKDIATKMNFKEDYVRQKKFRCMTQLKKLVNEDPDFQNL